MRNGEHLFARDLAKTGIGFAARQPNMGCLPQASETGTQVEPSVIHPNWIALNFAFCSVIDRSNARPRLDKFVVSPTPRPCYPATAMIGNRSSSGALRFVMPTAGAGFASAA